jgi:hypothetical protein
MLGENRELAFEVLHITQHLILFGSKDDVAPAKVTGVFAKREVKVKT